MSAGKKHKVQAFTILEVTITMMIAAIVIGITYTSYSIINRSFLAFKAKNEDIALLTRIDQLLKRDFEQADDIFSQNQTVIMKKSDGAMVSYEITGDRIIRRSDIIDTFKVSTWDYKTQFEGSEKNLTEHTDIQPGNDEDRRIDELIFTLIASGDSLSYHYHKTYSSINLIKRNPNAIN